MSVTLALQAPAPHIRTVIAGRDLSEREAFDAGASIMHARAPAAMIAARLAGLALLAIVCTWAATLRAPPVLAGGLVALIAAVCIGAITLCGTARDNNLKNANSLINPN